MAMSLPELCVRRPVFTAMLILLPVVLGLVGLKRMGTDLFPNVDLPIVTITTTRQGASAEEMETGVTKRIEEAVNTISGIDELASSSKEGISTVVISFVLEKNRDIAQQEVQGKINTILSQLPAGTDNPIIDKFDLDATPVMTVAVSGKRNIRQVTEIADKQIKDSLSSLPGVGNVTIIGGLKRAIQVAIDPAKLQAYGISVDEVKGALAAQNLELPGGRVDQNARELTLRTMGRVVDTRDFNDIIIKSVGGQPVRVRDLGHASDSNEEERGMAELDGRTAVNVIVQKQSGTNTIQVIETVKKRLAELQVAFAAEGKADIKMEVIRDQSRFIGASIHEVEKHLVLGALLVSLTILLFLRDWRTMIIASVSIPVSIIGTFLAMYVAGFTFNNITMLALVMAVGIVIDDAVVVHENIFRWMEEKGYGAWEASVKATKEIGLAVMATTFSLVVIFLPIAFMSGRVGRFFQSFGLTMAFSIMVSLLVSFTLTPMLCSRFLKLSKKSLEALARGDHSHHSGGVYGFIAERPYLWMLRWSLKHRWAIVLLAIVVMLSLFPFKLGDWIAGSVMPGMTAEQIATVTAKQKQWAWANYPGLGALLGFDFIPQDDQNEFEVAITTPSGYSLQRSEETFREIRDRLQKLEGVTHTLINIGDTTGKLTRATADVTKGTIYCSLIDLTKRKYSQFDVMDRARKIMADYPDLRSSVQIPANVASGGNNTDLEFNLTGPDLDKLTRFAEHITAGMRKVEGLKDADTTLPERQPELRVVIDRTRANELGLDIRTIAASLQTLVGGQVVSDYKDNETGEQYDVWLRATGDDRSTREAIGEMTVMSPRAGLVKLLNVAHLEEARGPAQIDRYQRQRKVTIVGNLGIYNKENQFLFFRWISREKLPTGSAVTAIQKIIAEMRNADPSSEFYMSPEYQADFTGRAKVMAESAGAFFIAFGLSLIFMYMILAAQFESFTHPVAILLAVPLTIPFAVLSLILLGQSLNLYAILGMFLLFGIVKKNGILQVDYANTLRRENGAKIFDAVMEANQTRLRPILMTTVMLVAGMIPIALGQGAGAAARASMAKVIIGGQVLSLVLTLLVTPVAYTLFDDAGRLVRRLFGEKRQQEKVATATALTNY